MTKNKNQKHEGLSDVEQALTKTEQFFEKNLNIVIYSVAGIIVVVLGFLGYQKFIMSPKANEAKNQMFGAQTYFEKDSFNLAINGDGNSLGFLDIIENYGSTKSGKLANYYVGISYLHIGEYELAIEYLNKFSTDDILLEPLTNSAIGDAYVELNKYSKAISAYKKALDVNDNKFTAPTILVKLGFAYEANNQKTEAMAQFKEVMDNYSSSSEFATAEKCYAKLNQ